MGGLAACLACFPGKDKKRNSKKAPGEYSRNVIPASAAAAAATQGSSGCTVVTGHSGPSTLFTEDGHLSAKQDVFFQCTSSSRMDVRPTYSRAEWLATKEACLDTLVLQCSPNILTVTNCDGRVMYQNPQSKVYFGDRVDAPHGEDVLLLLFSLDPTKRIQMLDELERMDIGAVWKSVVRVPYALDCIMGRCLDHGGQEGWSGDPNAAINASDKDEVLEQFPKEADLLQETPGNQVSPNFGSNWLVTGSHGCAEPSRCSSGPTVVEALKLPRRDTEQPLEERNSVADAFALAGNPGTTEVCLRRQERKASCTEDGNEIGHTCAIFPEAGPCRKPGEGTSSAPREKWRAPIAKPQPHRRGEGAAAKPGVSRRVLGALRLVFPGPTAVKSLSEGPATAPAGANGDLKFKSFLRVQRYEAGLLQNNSGSCGVSSTNLTEATPARSAWSSTSMTANPLATSTLATFDMDALSTLTLQGSVTTESPNPGSPAASTPAAPTASPGVEVERVRCLERQRIPRRSVSCRALYARRPSSTQVYQPSASTVDAIEDGRASFARRTVSRPSTRALAFALSLRTSPYMLVTTPQLPLPPVHAPVVPSTTRTGPFPSHVVPGSRAESRGQLMAAEFDGSTSPRAVASTASASAAVVPRVRPSRSNSALALLHRTPSTPAWSVTLERGQASSSMVLALKPPTDKSTLDKAVSGAALLPAPASRLVGEPPPEGLVAPASKDTLVSEPVLGSHMGFSAAKRKSTNLARFKDVPSRRQSPSMPRNLVCIASATGLPARQDGARGLRGPNTDQMRETPLEPECWHEVWAKAARDPVSGADVIVLTQMDVTAKVVAERHLALVMETEHRLVEQLFPRHILQHITEDWTSREAAAPAAAQGQAREGNDGGGSLRWRPVVRDCNALATWHPEVTLLFADIRGFTPMCKKLPPHRVMTLLNALYSRYDEMLDRYGVYKVETIGDCYFVAGGLIHEDDDGMVAVRDRDSEEDPLHARRVFMFAKAMLSAAREVLMPTTGQPVEIRIGLHTGPVVSGVVGTRMPRFCLFGDTVNTASRMESTGMPGAIHASEETYRRLGSSDGWEPTGGIEVDGQGFMQTYLWKTPPSHARPLCGAGGSQPVVAGQGAR